MIDAGIVLDSWTAVNITGLLIASAMLGRVATQNEAAAQASIGGADGKRIKGAPVHLLICTA